MSVIGIDAISFYVPRIYLSIKELSKNRDLEYEKLSKGLGLEKMSIPDADEDPSSFAANALIDLFIKNKINPSEIGRIYMGTESALDSSKPSATYATDLVEQYLEKDFGKRCLKNCDITDMTFACIGGVDALQNSVDWISSNTGKKAIVVCSDLSKYSLNSTGEYTQGAGAVAMYITANPSIIAFEETIGISMEHVGDFFKPRRILKNDDLEGTNTVQKITNSEKGMVELFYEEPVFDGQYSNDCYSKRIKESMAHFQLQKKTNLLENWDKLVFHLPYAFQGRRMMSDIWLEWMKENNQFKLVEEEIGPYNHEDVKSWKKAASKSSLYKKFVTEKIADGEVASGEIGNMYTASIFMSLISHLFLCFQNQEELIGKNFGFISYGSGSKSKTFEGIIQSDWKNKIKDLDMIAALENRTFIDFETYEKLHNSLLSSPIENNNNFTLESISKEPNKEGFRYYS